MPVNISGPRVSHSVAGNEVHVQPQAAVARASLQRCDAVASESARRGIRRRVGPGEKGPEGGESENPVKVGLLSLNLCLSLSLSLPLSLCLSLSLSVSLSRSLLTFVDTDARAG